MKTNKLLLGVFLVALVGVGGWFGWRSYTAPVPPTIPLDGVEPNLAAKVQQAIQGVRDHPRSSKAWGELSCVLVANGFYEQAIPCLLQAERFDSDDPRWPYLNGSVSLLLAKPRQGIPKLQQALLVARRPEDRQPILFLLAQSLVEDGQLEEAERYLQALRPIDGDGPQAQFILGLLAVARENGPLAKEYLVPLADHPCVRKQVCSILATVTRDDPKLAQQYRTRSADLPPDMPWPNPLDADVRRYRIDPTTQISEYNALLAAGRREEAIEFLKQSVARSPEESTCFTLGFALLGQNQFGEAGKALRQVIALNPRNMKASVMLGVALLEQGEQYLREPTQKEQALELFRQAIDAEDKALSYQTDLAVAHLVRGRALKHLNRNAEALAALRSAVLVGPDLSEAHQTLGETLAEAGQLREALEHLENAVRVAKPNDPRPRQALEKWQGKAKSGP